MEILLTGNTGYLTEEFIGQAFPEGNIRILGNTVLKSRKKKRITVLRFPRSRQELREIFETYAFDRVVYFSNYLTFRGECKGEAERIQILLQSGRWNPDTQIIYLSGWEDTGILVNAAEQMWMHYAANRRMQIKVIRTPHLYSARMREDYLYRIFQRMDTKEKLVFQEAPEQKVFFLCMEDLARLLYRVFESWDRRSEILFVPDTFEISFGQFALALNQLKPELRLSFGKKISVRGPGKDDKILRQRYKWFPGISVLEELPDLYRQYHKVKKSRLRGWEKLKGKRAQRKQWLWIPELLAAFAVTELLTRLSENQMQFRMIDFRLLFIVLISSIYGMNQGIVAAALGSAALAFSFFQNGTDCFTLFYEPMNWIPFIAYFIVGAICGYVHLKRRDDLLFLRKENERVREKFSFLRGLYCDTVDICKAYKKQILGRRDSFGKVYEIAKRLNVAYPKELCAAIIQVLEELLENRTICVYSVEKKQDHARLKAASKGAFQRVPHRIRTSDCRDIIERLKAGEIWKNTTFRKTYPMYMAGIRRDSELIWIVSVQEVKASQMSFYDMNRIKVVCGLAEIFLGRMPDAQEAEQGVENQ